MSSFTVIDAKNRFENALVTADSRLAVQFIYEIQTDEETIYRNTLDSLSPAIKFGGEKRRAMEKFAQDRSRPDHELHAGLVEDHKRWVKAFEATMANWMFTSILIDKTLAHVDAMLHAVDRNYHSEARIPFHLKHLKETAGRYRDWAMRFSDILKGNNIATELDLTRPDSPRVMAALENACSPEVMSLRKGVLLDLGHAATAWNEATLGARGQPSRMTLTSEMSAGF